MYLSDWMNLTGCHRAREMNVLTAITRLWFINSVCVTTHVLVIASQLGIEPIRNIFRNVRELLSAVKQKDHTRARARDHSVSFVSNKTE